jgi:predicted ATP-dependent endonuclease of OLD family
MRLVSATVQGFKRFAEPTTLKVDGHITALVGPNEVGKTSLLAALAHTNDTEPFTASELSRGLDVDEISAPVQLRFLLESDDLAALGGIAGASEVRWYTFSKASDGSRGFTLEPPVRRETSSRALLARDLRRAAAHRTLQTLLDEPETEFGRAGMLTLADSLEAAVDEDLPDELLGSLQEWSEHLSGEIADSAPAYIRSLPQALQEQLAREREDRPTIAAGRILGERRPRFLLFGDDERSLDNTYELSELESPTRALQNLARLAELDLSELAAALRQERRGEVQGLRDRANRTLSGFFRENWRQTGLAVELSVSGTDLELYVREESGEYWQLAERSDGLRWFVALVAYLHSEGLDIAPILLVDEAEQHLHYDGQADLVRAFERQEAVADVIYTTHSAGCLPQDLGTGVRVIARRGEAGSEVRNSLWSDEALRDGAGFSSLLMQMGASTFAFTATRRAVMCEGVTEVALLPTLLRQAMDLQTLPFQLVPGLANVAGNSVVHLDMAAARVAFLVDSDAGGRAIVKKLRKAGVADERILRLGPPSSTRTLEDLVDPRVLQLAVNTELARRGIEKRVPVSPLRATPRFREVERWCRAQRPTVAVPGKLAVAQQLLALARQGETIVNPASMKEIAALFGRIMGLLG